MVAPAVLVRLTGLGNSNAEFSFCCDRAALATTRHVGAEVCALDVRRWMLDVFAPAVVKMGRARRGVRNPARAMAKVAAAAGVALRCGQAERVGWQLRRAGDCPPYRREMW